MGKYVKRACIEQELPRVNGDAIFGTFILVWSSMMVHQSLNPWTTFAFERWIYDGGDYMPSPTPLWTAENYWVPGVCTFLYFTMLLHMPEIMKTRERPIWLKKAIFLWNIILSVSSTWAAARIAGNFFSVLSYKTYVTPVYTDGVRSHAFYEIVCDIHPVSTCTNHQNMICMYLMFFCMSKIPEMIDTLWLILGKKKVIFLHWFHHTSVMWFCWLAWTHILPMGTVFALMNLSVHSIMYAWYALAAADRWLAVGLKPKKLFSQTVTVLQILQMILGFSLTVYVHFEKDCGNPREVTRYALGMYGVYLILFVHFFYRAYCSKRKASMKKPPSAESRFFVEYSRVNGVDKRPVGGSLSKQNIRR